jgi:hypothetical protein
MLALIARICNSDTLIDAYNIFRENQKRLEGCKIIFASKAGGSPGFAVNRTFSEGAAIRSLFATEKVIVLDSATIKDMESGISDLPCGLLDLS